MINAILLKYNINIYYNMSTHKQQILEPISTIIRLILLAFKPKNTKIAIRDHHIVLCEPCGDVYYGIHISQSLNRYINNDCRSDIVVLNNTICNFINWYVKLYKETDKNIYKKIINVARYLCVGLNELQATYKTDNAGFAIQYYINILTSVIEDRFHDDMIYTPINNENELLYSTIFNTNKLKNFWPINELELLIEQIDKCFIETHNMEDQIYYKKMWPEPKNVNDSLVQGHLIGITNVLNVMDKRFASMIIQSIKGIN